MLKLAVILFVAGLAAAEKRIDINEALDKALVTLNDQLTERGFGLRRIPDDKQEDVELHAGVQIGLNSMERTGDSYIIEFDNGTFFIDTHLGFRLFAVAYGSIKFNGVEMSGIYTIHNNSIHISYLLTPPPDCHVQLADYQYDVLTQVDFQSSLADYSGDVSDAFTERALPRINQIMQSKRALVERAIQRHACQQHGENMPYPEQLFSFFKSVMDLY